MSVVYVCVFFLEKIVKFNNNNIIITTAARVMYGPGDVELITNTI